MENQQKPDQTAAKTIVILFIIAIFIGIFFGIKSLFTYSGSTEKRPHDCLDAYVISQEFVKNKLKAPATAEFPDAYSIVTKQIDANTFEINSHVDSQNSFGALIGASYHCKINYNNLNDSVMCTEFQLHEN